MFFFTPMQINLLALKVNAVDNASILNAGSFQSVDQFLSYKRNQGIGEQNGDISPIYVPISTVVDPELVDSPAAKNSAV